MPYLSHNQQTSDSAQYQYHFYVHVYYNCYISTLWVCPKLSVSFGVHICGGNFSRSYCLAGVQGLGEFVQRYIIMQYCYIRIIASSPYVLLLFIVTSFNFHHIYVFTISNDSKRFICQCDQFVNCLSLPIGRRPQPVSSSPENYET